MADVPELYQSTRAPVRASFFDLERAQDFWKQNGSLPKLEDAFEQCKGNAPFDYWNRVWLDTEDFYNGTRSRSVEFINKIRRSGKFSAAKQLAAEYKESRVKFTLDYILARYGAEGADLVHSDIETVKYCHDLSRTYELWRDRYVMAVGGAPFSLVPRYDRVSVPYNEWSVDACDYIRQENRAILADDGCMLPDWRTKAEVANYDTALINSVLNKTKAANESAQTRKKSREVVEAYLEEHGADLSDADRAAMEAMLTQLK